MKILIYGGEAFPIYEIHRYDDVDSELTTLDVDQETISKWKVAFDNFSKVQEEIVQEMEKQGKGDKVWFQRTWEGFHL